jgi:hypothetical protein
MMTDPRELLQRYGAPEPLAIVLPTEIRSDGGLQFQMLSPPQWATGAVGTAVIMEWSCELDLDALQAVSLLLREPNKITGLQAEAAINRTLMDEGLGNYLGTFIDEGRPPYVIRMLIGLRPAKAITEDELNQRLARICKIPPVPVTVASQAAAVLRALRGHWWHGQRRAESRSMLLSLTNIETLMERSIYVPPSPGPKAPPTDESQSAEDSKKAP